MSFRLLSVRTALKFVGLLAAGMVSVSASAQSSKATFAFGDLVRLPACSSSTQGACSVANDSEWRTILKQQIKTAQQKDLFIDSALQCGIVTDTTVKSLNGSLDSAEARATVRVRVRITDGDGNVSYAQPSTSIDANQESTGTNGGVVYCDRIQSLAAKFSGLNCTADLTTGAVTCTDPEELQLILKTMNAASFNFVAADLKSGVNTIEVQARSTAATGTTGTNGSLANSNAFIGVGAVAVEEVRMVKGNDGTTLEL